MKKFCPKCNTEQNTSTFTKDRTTSDGLYYICKTCKRAETNKRYKLNISQQQYIKEHTKNRREVHKKIINSIKTNLGCMVCGENSHYSLIEFHHKFDNKDMVISQNINRNLKKVFTEIQKCICLCANCHRKVHADILDVSNVQVVSSQTLDAIIKEQGIEDINIITYDSTKKPTTKCWMYNAELQHQCKVSNEHVSDFLSKGYVLGIKPRA